MVIFLFVAWAAVTPLPAPELSTQQSPTPRAHVTVGIETSSDAVPKAGCLRTPVAAPITGRFEHPVCPYCAGRRAVEFDARSGAPVVAPASGTVTFVGVVAGTPFVTIGVARPPHERLVTLGGVVPAAAGGVTSGSIVRAGQTIGEVALGPVRLSVRIVVPGRRADYVDPEPMLGRMRGPVRLVPDSEWALFAPRRVHRTWSCLRPLWLLD